MSDEFSFFRNVECTCTLCGERKPLGQIAQGFLSPKGYEFCNCLMQICTDCANDRRTMLAHLEAHHKLPLETPKDKP